MTAWTAATVSGIQQCRHRTPRNLTRARPVSAVSPRVAPTISPGQRVSPGALNGPRCSLVSPLQSRGFDSRWA